MKTIAFGLVLAALSSRALAADAPPPTCQLPEIASLDMETEDSGVVTVPVTINDVSGRWMVDTGNISSMVADTIARRLQLKRAFNPYGGALLGGIPIFEVANVDTITFAGMRGGSVSLAVAPEAVLPSNTIGMLAPDIMRNYDIEFDFAGGKFNVFEPNSCPGNAVYWTRTTFAQVPIKLDRVGHILIPATLDGKPLTAAVDTGAEGSIMSLDAAQELFGIDPSNPALKPLGNREVNGMARTAAYRYPFASLTFEGVQVSNPNITILKTGGYHRGLPDLVLGIETLRQLHMYIAYQEGAIYLTPAEAR
jgi:predicted aspartyl protease